ncbi:hypothetical protein EVG20_g7274, partial [Dentipellis fragilis]
MITLQLNRTPAIALIPSHPSRLMDWNSNPVPPVQFDHPSPPKKKRVHWDDDLNDPTAKPAKASDIDRLCALYAYLDGEGREDDKDGYQRRYIKDIIDNQRLYPILEVVCSDADEWSTRHSYLTGKPASVTRCPTRIGRATKCYFAYDVDRDRLVFMKEYCSTPRLSAGFQPYWPGVMLEDLNASSPKDQKHMNEEHLRQISGGAIQEVPKARFLHRIVTDRIGRPLETYKDQRELIICLWNAFEAHREAWGKAGILHGDVSVSSIMIDVRTGKGFLNDWDMCKYRDELEKGATQHARSGTWDTMSAALLKFSRKPNQLSDDLESFVHIATLMGLRFHVHDMSEMTTINGKVTIDHKKLGEETRLAAHYKAVYSQSNLVQGMWEGGRQKFYRLRLEDPGVEFEYPEDPLQLLITKFYKLFGPLYNNLDVKRYQTSYGHVHKKAGPTNRIRNPADIGIATEIWSDSVSAIPGPPPQSQTGTFGLEELEHSHFNHIWGFFGREDIEWPTDDKTIDQLQGAVGIDPRCRKR